MANLLESMLKGQGGGEYKNMAKEKYLMLSERLFLMNNKDIMKNCLKILIKVTENIIKSNGEDPKFLCLKMSNNDIYIYICIRLGILTSMGPTGPNK